MGTEKLRGGRPPRIFNDPDIELMSPQDREQILKAWEDAKPKTNPKFGIPLIMGTSGDVIAGDGFKKIWDET